MDQLDRFLMLICFLWHGNRNGGTSLAIECIVHDDTAKDHRIGNGHLLAANKTKLGGANLNIFNFTDVVRGIDFIADMKRTLHQNIKACHQVLENILNGEGACYGERTNDCYRHSDGNLPERECPEDSDKQS